MSNKNIYLGLAFILISVVLVYHSTFVWLYEQFSAQDSYYSHGVLIPFITGFLIWKKRDKLKAINFDSSSLGLVLFVSGLLIQIVGNIVEVYLISEFSLILVIFGITLYLFGTKVGKEVLFPLAFLIFMFPIPMFLINHITFPMRIIVTKSAVFTLSKFGLPITQRGFEIIFPNASLVVGTPCSGLRSLIAFLALSSLFAYFLNTSLRRKISLFVMAVPVAFMSNFFRIILLSLVAFIYGSKVAVEGFFHTFSGVMVFVIGFVFLLALRRLIICQTLKKGI